MNYDYAKIAKEVIQAVGGSENIKSAGDGQTEPHGEQDSAAERQGRQRTLCAGEQ